MNLVSAENSAVFGFFGGFFVDLFWRVGRITHLLTPLTRPCGTFLNNGLLFLEGFGFGPLDKLW